MFPIPGPIPFPTFSNGATYSDLDNDGDLDIVVNNINDEAIILQNNAVEQGKGKYVQLQVRGSENNKVGVELIATLHLEEGGTQIRQLTPTRGFLSSVSNKLHFGLGQNDSIVSLELTWPDGKRQTLTHLVPNQVISISYEDAAKAAVEEEPPAAAPLFTKLTSTYSHIDPYFNDYAIQVLLPHKLSQVGPAAAVADVNGDGLEDVFLGGGHTQPGQLLLANRSGNFTLKNTPAFLRDKQKEDVGACFFDADNDGDPDLYVVSGSYEFPLNSKLQQDRLYLNDGAGNFVISMDRLPQIAAAGSMVTPADYDGDGDMDLFVGSRVIPGQYPFPPISYLLVNDKGKFTIRTKELAPELIHVGMVTDARWEDIDQDQDVDLIVTGEWMGIKVFENEKGALRSSQSFPQLDSTIGWWNRIHIADIDADGDLDIIAGNLGLNSKFHASPKEPFHVYTHDFDYNGTVDVFLAKNYEGSEVPIRGKTCTAMQMPHLAQKISTFNEFAKLDLGGILGPGIESALHYQANEFRSGIFYNEGAGNFEFVAFPLAAQQSPINGILYDDFDGDGIQDLLLAGNNYMPEIETTRSDAGIGVLLKGKGGRNFVPVPHGESGFFAHKDVRNLIKVSTRQGTVIWAINNKGTHDLFKASK